MRGFAPPPRTTLGDGSPLVRTVVPVGESSPTRHLAPCDPSPGPPGLSNPSHLRGSSIELPRVARRATLPTARERFATRRTARRLTANLPTRAAVPIATLPTHGIGARTSRASRAARPSCDPSQCRRSHCDGSYCDPPQIHTRRTATVRTVAATNRTKKFRPPGSNPSPLIPSPTP